MQNKIIKLLVTFILLFSLRSFSQTPEKSKHPLLDKYYPQIQNTDTGKAVTTQIKPVPETKPAPPLTTTTIPAVTTAPAVTTTTVPAMTTTSVVTTTPAMTTTTTFNKPTTVTTQTPVQKVQTKPAPPLYSETRLGSSTKQYDTWEKNNNGAGAVTTSPK
jgi:hypothetical protein